GLPHCGRENLSRIVNRYTAPGSRIQDEGAAASHSWAAAIIPAMRPEMPPGIRPGAVGPRSWLARPGRSGDPRIASFALHNLPRAGPSTREVLCGMEFREESCGRPIRYGPPQLLGDNFAADLL